jgi:asparagine synthase (glutamine-hydrolysing)
MCGILGMFLFNSKSSLRVNPFNDALNQLKHRGPDNTGYKIFQLDKGDLYLGHNRLSIIDLSSDGNQPMICIDNRYTIVYNGEIYNYLELRQELKSFNIYFKTNTDTEVLLESWKYWGWHCLKKIIGMFAFSIFDSVENKIYFGRDAFGIKPLYLFKNEASFIFASEVSAIKSLMPSMPSYNFQVIYNYIVNSVQDVSRDTFYENIYSLQAGHYIELNLNNFKLSEPKKWWNPNFQVDPKISFRQASESIRHLFLSSLKYHLRSDVPIGVALSGGLDSSAIACAIRHIEPNIDLHTFSYVASDQNLSEEIWIDKVNSSINSKVHKIRFDSSDYINDFDDLIITQGEPFVSSSIYAQYRVFKQASNEGIKVVLEGQGGDEVMAGYDGYQGQRMLSLWESKNYLQMIEFSYNWNKWPGRNGRSAWKSFLGQILPDKYYLYFEKMLNVRNEPSWIDLNNKISLKVNRIPYRLKKEDYFKKRRLIEVLYRAQTEGGLQSLLRYGDRNAMRFSIENRVPFLTIELAEFMFSLPENYLVSTKGETKSVFRDSMRGIIPEVILNRKDKIGFETPQNLLLRDLIKRFGERDYIHSQSDILNQNKVFSRLDDIILNKVPIESTDWRLVNLLKWMKLNS